jgi:hypothetical protein
VIVARVLAILWMALTAICAETQPVEIRLKLLNPWSGKPVAGQPVILLEAKGEVGAPLQKSELLKETRAQTGPDGTAVFLVGGPIPDRLLFDLGALRTCPHKGDLPAPNGFRAEQIIKSGVVVADSCIPKNWHGKFRWQGVKAKPGEIIFFGSRPLPGQW